MIDSEVPQMPYPMPIPVPVIIKATTRTEMKVQKQESSSCFSSFSGLTELLILSAKNCGSFCYSEQSCYSNGIYADLIMFALFLSKVFVRKPGLLRFLHQTESNYELMVRNSNLTIV